MGGFAWVTLATNDSYSMGALVLAHSLRRVNTAHQLVVLITPGVTEAMKTQLSAVFNVVKLVDVLDSKDAENLALLARPELGITFTKIHCWKLTEFDKCVFLDADTLVLQNSDELFERDELSAAPDAGWPDCFNSGVFVYKPSKETFQALIEFALIHGSFDGGDQGLLNLFFSDWPTKDIKKHLPFVYNMCSTATYSYLPAFKQFGGGLKIIHFIGAAKPWLQPFNTETGLASVSGESQHLVQFVQLWWDLFCTNVHPSLSTEMAGLAGALATVTLGAPLTVEQRALEEHLRRQGWEQGNIDYMGKDSFANIWQKISETLASGPLQGTAPPEEAPAPVAPVAAPVYVSSVEISPTGPIDTSPSQANYAPVSAIKPTVEASDTKDATKALSSETATVAPEPKSSVAELIPTEASTTSSATLGTPASTPQVTSEPQSAPVIQPSPPKDSVIISEIAPAVPQETLSAPSVPPTATSAPVSTDLSSKVASEISSVTALPVPSSPAQTESQTDTSATNIASITLTDVVKTELSEAQVPKDSQTKTSTSESSVIPPAGTPAPPSTEQIAAPPLPETQTEVLSSKESPIPVPASPILSCVIPVTTDPAPVVLASVDPTSIEIPATTPEKPPVLAPKVPTPGPLEMPASVPAPTPVEIPALSTVISDPLTLIPAETQVLAPITSAPAAPTAIESPVSTPIVAASAPLDTPVSPSEPSVPTQTGAPVSPPVVPTPPVTPSTEIPPPVPPTPVPTDTNVPAPATIPASESIVPVSPIKTEPTQQPQTPIVTEPTPPTSPPIAAEAPLLTKLQVETEVPGTPPAGSSVQPSLTGVPVEEPPVPPKRKGSSKAQQDTKNQKGGKPSKGKK